MLVHDLSYPTIDDENKLVAFFSAEVKKFDIPNVKYHLKHRGLLSKSSKDTYTITFECSKRLTVKCPLKMHVNYCERTHKADIFRSFQVHNHNH